MMSIALAAIHSDPAFTPLALLYLRAHLVERGGVPAGDVDVAEFTLDTPPAEIARRILRSNPRIAGLSCYVWNVTTFMEVVKLLKKARPDLLVVLGGPEVGPQAASLVDAYPEIHAVVKSEGEAPFTAIVERVAAGRSLHGVDGIVFRDGGDVVDAGDAPLLKDVDDLPSPHFSDDGVDYRRRVICLETQRGCVFKCNFCFYNKDLSVRNRRFGLDRVKRELLHWLDRDVEQIYLMDPVFNLNAERANEICRFIAANNPKRVPIHTEIWAEFVDDEMARLMREANFTYVEVGLQTTDTTALMTVERRLKLEQFVRGVDCLKKHGIDFELQLIYGLPGDTRVSFMKSLAFAQSLEPPQLAVFPLMVLPGTELWRKADAIGLEYEPTPPYYVRSHPTMTPEDIAYGWELIEQLLFLHRKRKGHSHEVGGHLDRVALEDACVVQIDRHAAEVE